MRYGMDPLRFAALEGDDLRFVSQVLHERDSDESERTKALIESISSQTAAKTTRWITAWFARVLK